MNDSSFDRALDGLALENTESLCLPFPYLIKALHGLSRRKTLRCFILSLVEGPKGALTFPLVVTAANTVEEYGAQATSPTAEFRS